MGLILSHLLAGVLGAGAVTGVLVGALRAVTLPGRQARGIAKVINKLAPNLAVTGSQVQAANVALAEDVIGKIEPK